MAKSKLLNTGDLAPDFLAPATNGAQVQLSELLKRKTVVLYFYPKDNTPGCTAEACSFRDQYEDFVDAGAEVVGVSLDSMQSHDKFVVQHRLPYLLVSDTDGKIHALYGIGAWFGLLRDRVTFVIDRTGMIRHRFSSQLRVHEHVRQALEIVRTLERANTTNNV